MGKNCYNCEHYERGDSVECSYMGISHMERPEISCPEWQELPRVYEEPSLDYILGLTDDPY